MTRDDITRMAREAGLFQHVPPTSHVLLIYDLMAFAALVAAHEREACAQVCLEEAPSLDGQLCAAAIRARGEK
jgi:hypothetical protein